MDRQLIFRNTLFFNGLANQTCRQAGRLTVCKHPAHHVAAVNIEDHVQVKVRPFLRTEQLSNVP